MNKGPWENLYQKMAAECPENDVERQVIEMLGSGKDMSECLEYWVQMGMDKESFLTFMDRADKWETDELRRINKKSG